MICDLYTFGPICRRTTYAVKIVRCSAHLLWHSSVRHKAASRTSNANPMSRFADLGILPIVIEPPSRCEMRLSNGSSAMQYHNARTCFFSVSNGINLLVSVADCGGVLCNICLVKRCQLPMRPVQTFRKLSSTPSSKMEYLMGTQVGQSTGDQSDFGTR